MFSVWRATNVGTMKLGLAAHLTATLCFAFVTLNCDSSAPPGERDGNPDSGTLVSIPDSSPADSEPTIDSGPPNGDGSSSAKDGASADAQAQLTMSVWQVDGNYNFWIPLSSPGHAAVRLLSNGKLIPWPDGTKFESKATTASECVYAKAFGARTFLFAKYSCDETVHFSATLPDTTKVETDMVVHPYGEFAARTYDAVLVDDASLLPSEPLSDHFSPAAPVPLGATAKVAVRVQFATTPAPKQVVVYPEELSSVSINNGSAITGSSPTALQAAAIGTATVTGTFTLPHLGQPDNPFMFQGSGIATVIEPQALANLWTGWIDDYVANISVQVGAPCRAHFLMGVYGATAATRYQKMLKWADATAAFADPAFATLNVTTGDVCGVKPGATLLSMSIGTVIAKQRVTVQASPSAPLGTRVDPSPLVISAARATGGCTSFKLFARVGTGVEEDVSQNPTITATVFVAQPDGGFEFPWASCGVKTAGTGLECCAYPDPGTSARPTTTVSVWYANVSANASLTQP